VFRVFRISRSLAIVIALAVSLAANATLFVGGVLYDTVGNVLEKATGLQTASAKQRKAIKSLQKENRQLRGQIKRIRGVARTAAKRTVARSARSVKRGLATLAGKAFPVAGVAVAVGVTAWEIKDLCDTIRDMNGISREIDPSQPTVGNETTVCSVPVPTTEEILKKVTESPHAVWQASREFVPELPSLSDTGVLTAGIWGDTKEFLDFQWDRFEFWRREEEDEGG
jgi:hypothetical protein